MSASEIAELCENLPPEKRDEVADFARFLLSREQDDRWEKILEDASPRPRLEAFLQSTALEQDKPLDPNQL